VLLALERLALGSIETSRFLAKIPEYGQLVGVHRRARE